MFPFGLSGESFARLVITLTLKAAVVVLVAPWVIIDVARFVTRRGKTLIVAGNALIRATDAHAACPRGHTSSLVGVWECRGCGGLFAGYAFARCPICRSSAGYVNCEHCGMAVRNPFL